MAKRINLNNEWKYSEEYREEMLLKSFDLSSMKEVRIPHTNIETPFHYFDERIYQFVSCYRRKLQVDKDWRGKTILLTFEGVGHVAKVYVNSMLVTTHYGGYTAFTADISRYLDYEATDNFLTVVVDSRESCNLPPFGNVIDYLTYGGIYREVFLEVKEEVSIEDIFVTTEDPQKEQKKLKAEITLRGKLEQGLYLRYTLYPAVSTIKEVKDYSAGEVKDYSAGEMEDHSTGDVNDYSARKVILSGEKVVADGNVFRISEFVTGEAAWDITSPNLYELNVMLHRKEEDKELLLEETTVRFGFRTCEFKEDGFYLNNKKIKLLGLNRHQSFPYVGYAMPKRMQRRDAEILKHELCVNAVRTSHYPQSKHFIDRCDELGLLVFTEIPGWQHIGDETWKQIACEHVREMILQYRNHPSIILWGVRINESQDEDAFYTKTNQLAHQLDPSRGTGGVRYLKKSNLLEDVYTYNDFLHNGITKGLDRREDVTSNANAPYMVTEFNGHMFPTKPFDNEEHRLQHALRHAYVLDALFEQENIAGGFGWCMFDYNTHKDFGSGDKICYHGVLDMFRNPKTAASVYASQSDDKDICVVSSSLDIGEHPASNIGDVFVFTNADSVRLYKNDSLIKEFYPSTLKYSNLPHPPVVIDDFVGDLLEQQENYSHKTAEALKEILFAVKKYGQNNLPVKYKLKMGILMLKEHLTLEEGTRLFYKHIGNWGGSATTFRFEAYKGGTLVKVIEKKAVNQPRLEILTDTTQLKEEESYDVAGVRIIAVDECGNQLPYYQEPVTFEAWGSVELIGPMTVSLKGGAAGTFVKTKGVIGEGGLRILQETLGNTEIIFTVEI